MARNRDGDVPPVQTCRRCKTKVHGEAQFCPACGSPPDAPDAPLVCTNCGHTTKPGHRFCTSCGAELSEEGHDDGDEADNAPRTTRGPIAERAMAGDVESETSERELTAFRRQLDPYLENGWVLRGDDGDSVELSYQDFGSIGIHLALALFLVTIGWGNLLYALYSGMSRKKTETIDAGTAPQEWPDNDPTHGGETVHWALGILLPFVTLFSILGLVSLQFNAVAWSVLCGGLIATMTLLAPINRRLRNRGELSEFGWQTETDERLVHAAVECTSCASSVQLAAERSYRKYFAVAGVPIITDESGENYYCEECCKTALSTSAYMELSEMLTDETTDTDTEREESLVTSKN